MTTPRVTVPVEQLENWRSDLSLHGVGDIQTAVEIDAMLSAAPAPEGGAVSIWSDARNVFVRYAELFAMTERYEEASAIADKAAREIEALATREEAPADQCASHKAEGIALDPCCPTCEAPAEAGEDIQKRVERVVFEDFYGSPLAGSKERLAKALIREFGLSALRAQPPARSGEGQ